MEIAEEYLKSKYPHCAERIKSGNANINMVVEIMESYAKDFAKQEVLKWHKAIGDFLAEINKT